MTKTPFEQACDALNQEKPFYEALEQLIQGKKVRMREWSEDVFISLEKDNGQMTAPFLYVTSKYGKVPWTPTQIEILSNEWVIKND